MYDQRPRIRTNHVSFLFGDIRMSSSQSHKRLVYTMFSDACLVVKDDPGAEISARFHFDSSELKMIGQL